ncbi:beta strand repeat-containing protein [Aliarcobacter butzleri]|uniref:beta strand repeat-containing protein n=1 Tax=Aliarcobacter butzleri TaxID=28197 RepID=UPI002B24BF90|nr:hypothetical protein [Aliarcobacter butzleri]
MALLTFKGIAAQAIAQIANIDVNTKVTITDAGYTADNLKTINDVTGLPIVLLKTAASQPLSGTAEIIADALDGITNYTGAIIVTGTPNAAELNAIAKLTTGRVTATLDPTATIEATTVAALNGVKTTDNITFKPVGALTVSGTSGLTALINLKKLLPNADFSAVTTVEGTSEDVAAIKSALKLVATDAAVEITAGQISAADANAIAKATDGVLKATINSGSVAATLKALADVDATDDITFKTTDKTVNARDLVKLGDKFQAPTNFDVTSIETITENAKDVGVDAVNVTAALAIAANADVKITGSISATIADLIALGTTGVVTATINSGTASNLLDALTDTTVNAYTITLLAGTAAAKDLTDLDAKTSVAVNANAISKITGSVTEIEAAYLANANKTISGLGNEAVEITGGAVAATDANKVLKLTTGVVTATVTADTAADLITDLADAKATDALTLTVNGATAAASDLKALDAKTSVVVNASAVTGITGSAADIKTVLAAKTITTAANVTATVDGVISAADANTITGATTGTVTATVAAGTAAALNKALVNANGTLVTGDNLTLTISKGTAAAADLIALDGKTLVNVNANAVTTITGSAVDVKTVLAAATIVKAADVAVTVSDTTVSVADANIIAAATTGVVTATIAAGTAADLNSLNDTTPGSKVNAYTLTVNNGVGVSADAAHLIALDGKTSVKVKVDAVDVNGDYSELEQIYVTNKAGFANLGNENVTIDNAVLASQVNTIAKATKGVVKASVTANTADVLVANLKDATATDLLTLTVTGAATAKDLLTLDGKTSVPLVVSGVTTITGTAADVKKVYDATGIGAPGANVNIILTGTVKASDADALALKTGGVVTATIAADTAAKLNEALTDNVAHNNALTLIVNGATAAAKDLTDLDAKTSVAVNANAISKITGSVTEIEAAYLANANKTISGLGNEAVEITGGAVAATDANKVLKLTTGVVTANIIPANAAALKTDLGDAKATDALTLTVTGAATAKDLSILDGKTSVKVDATGLTSISGSAAELKAVLAAKTTIGLAPSVPVTVDGTVSASDISAILKGTSGIVTATVNGATAAALKAALSSAVATDALTLTVNGSTATAADLLALDAKTSVNVQVDASSVTGSIADLINVYVSATTFAGLGDEAITVSGTVSAANAEIIAAKTTGKVTATVAADTAAALKAALLDAQVNAYELTVSGNDADAADLNILGGKTSVTVNAAAIKNIEGNGANGAADVKAAYDANANKTISGLGNETVNLKGATDANVSLVKAINDYTTGVITLKTLETTAGNFSLSQLGDLKGITGLDTIDTTGVNTNMTISLKDLLAANDSENKIDFTIVGDASDSISYTETTGWTLTAGGTTAAGNSIYINDVTSQVIEITHTNIEIKA